jgi:hypothetical protein
MRQRAKSFRLSGFRLSVVIMALLTAAIFSGCAPEQNSSGEMVPVNLSLVFDQQEANSQSPAHKVAAWVQEWILGLSTA